MRYLPVRLLVVLLGLLAVGGLLVLVSPQVRGGLVRVLDGELRSFYVQLYARLFPRPFKPNGTLPSLAPGTLWAADHETGDLSQWWYPGGANNCGGEFDSGTGISNVVSTIAHAGRYSAQMTLSHADLEDNGTRLFRWCEAQDRGGLYYSAWYFIPQRVAVNSWWGLMEWKSPGSFNAKFTLEVYNRPDGQMYLFLGRGQDSGGGSWTQKIKNIPVGRWFHIEAYYEKAVAATGRISVWQDGTRILDVKNVATANSDDLRWAVINYGSHLSPSDVTVYVDDAAISTTRIGP